jgi:hypothetical protein
MNSSPAYIIGSPSDDSGFDRSPVHGAFCPRVYSVEYKQSKPHDAPALRGGRDGRDRTLEASVKLLIVVLLLCTSLLGADPGSPIVGSILENPKRYVVSWRFGIEQWEQGHRSTFSDQLWHLTCSSPAYIATTSATDCLMERTIFYYLTWDRKKRAVVSTTSHSVQDGTLELLSADWAKGKLDFNLIHTDGSKIEVKLRVAYDKSTIHLDSFQAFGIARGILSDSLAAIEYRIPQYTRIVDVPIELPGYKSEEQGKLDDLALSLSPEDRVLWQRSMDKVLTASFHSDDLKKIVPDLADADSGKRELTSAEVQRIREHFADKLQRGLKSAGISPEGVQRLTSFYVERLSEGFAATEAH